MVCGKSFLLRFYIVIAVLAVGVGRAAAAVPKGGRG